MVIKNANVFTKDCVFKKGDICVSENKITEAVGGEIIDASGLYAIPGLVDIHFHGAVGHDFCDGTIEAIEAIAEYEAKNGVTEICPATMTLPEETLLNISKIASEYKNEKGAFLCGINMEGPFISACKKGAQNSKYIKEPDIDMFRKLQNASGGLYKLVDIAPESNNSMEFINELKNEVSISLAHTNADYDIAKAAFDAGARHVTHIYNAMPPFSHRAPGVIGAAADSLQCYAEIICDGIHIHPSVVRNTLKMFGDDRIVFISDSMMATGMSDGEYSLGGQAVTVKGNKATLHDGTIAGSATNLMDCMKNAVKNMSVPLETAVKCSTVNPAKAIGIFDNYGSIENGKIANIVLLDGDLNIKAVIMNGKVVSKID